MLKGVEMVFPYTPKGFSTRYGLNNLSERMIAKYPLSNVS
jgi:hypothetical protein